MQQLRDDQPLSVGPCDTNMRWGWEIPVRIKSIIQYNFISGYIDIPVMIGMSVFG